MTQDPRRKVTFYMNPLTSVADRFVLARLDQMPFSGKGREYRAMLLAGAALRELDDRLPELLAATLKEGVSRDEILNALGALLPSLIKVAPADGVTKAPTLAELAGPTEKDKGQMIGLLQMKS